MNGISKLKPNVKVKYKGVIDNEKIAEVIKLYHFSILPSEHENYGHSIFESLSAGCPVIISDNTPWRNLNQKKAGWDISLKNEAKFVEILNRAALMRQDEYNEWSKGAYNLAKTVTEDKTVLEQNKLIFNS